MRIFRYRRMKIMTVAKLLAVVCLCLAFTWTMWGGMKDIQLENLKIRVHRRTLEMVNKDRPTTPVLQGTIGMSGLTRSPISCDEADSDKSGACVLWTGVARLSVLPVSYNAESIKCYTVRWQSLKDDYVPMDCYDMKDAKWFGGSEVYSQHWPINKQRIPLQQFRSVDYLMHKNFHGCHGPILEPYWFNSRGVAIFVEDDRVPLHVGMNDLGNGRLCLAASWKGTTVNGIDTNKPPELSYTICQGNNAKHIHTFVAKNILGRPNKLPDERMLKSPVWSSWARFKTDVTQKDILQYAAEIEEYGFSHSQIEIDDMYTTTYGDFVFDKKKFPEAKNMTEDLKKRGFRVTSWVTPFANLDSQAFNEGSKKGFWLTDPTTGSPALVTWWQGKGGVLDVTNPGAVDWFVRRLKALNQEGVESFKFDAGEVGHLPPHVVTYNPLVNPNQYAMNYAKMVAQFGGLAEMRAGYRAQKYSVFFRVMDKDSVWGMQNGLQTMIPTVLFMSMVGYHFILPDMIGGNGYDPESFGKSTFPDRELYVRWVQLNTYLPNMQFSFTPWQYDEEVIEIARKFTKTHEDRATPAYLEAAEEMFRSGTPIIRPIWWIDPDDEEALDVGQQFLVGNDILVAPVVEKDARKRDIYLPKGSWKDDLRGKILQGKQWLRDYHVDLDELATFTHMGLQ